MTCVVPMGPGVGLGVPLGVGVGGGCTAICVAVTALDAVPLPVTDTADPTQSVAPYTTVDDVSTTGTGPLAVSNVNPYCVCADTVPETVVLVIELDDNVIAVAFCDEHLVPVPTNSPYCPTCAELPPHMLVDELVYTYM